MSDGRGLRFAAAFATFRVYYKTSCVMDNQDNRFPVPLKTLPPYVEVIKKYFGLSDPNLEAEMLLLPKDPERVFKIAEFVTRDEIVELFDIFSPKVKDGKFFYENLLWLVANLYYGDRYKKSICFFNNDINGDENVWYSIEKDMAKLFAFLQDHPQEEKITIQMGKDKVELDDAFKWFQSVMDNQVFPNCIPYIQNKEGAKSLLQKKAGRPQTRQEVNAVVNGISRFFADEKIIEGKAPKDLLDFIESFLVKMALIEENDEFVTTYWIKSQISNLQKPGKDARFFNLDVHEASAEKLKEVPWWFKATNWIFPVK